MPSGIWGIMDWCDYFFLKAKNESLNILRSSMLILENRKFIPKAFDSEEELEAVVVENAEYLFGPDSVYFPKSLIVTSDGTGTIPDGFVIDLSKRVWYIVEAEISRHSVWSHIAPQVAKQVIAASNPNSKKKLIEIAANRVKTDLDFADRFLEKGIHKIDIRQVLSDIFAKDPIVAMPIDAVKDDLRDWAATLRIPVKLWIVRKLVEFGKPDVVMYEIPDEYEPIQLAGIHDEETKSDLARYDVTISDLIEAKLLSVGQQIYMPYKPRNGEKKTYQATICDDGSIELLGKKFPSPSFAAMYGIQDAGSNRISVNGWVSWRLENGEFLSEVRDRYLAQK